MKRFRWLFPLLLVWSGRAFGAQGEVEIVDHPIECWPADEFLLIQASFVPPEDIQTVKFYFRSAAHADYYYIELTLGQSGGRAIAPKAHPDTAEVTFYTELVTHSFSAFRTEERAVPVASGSECKQRDPDTAYYTGENPDIAIGTTRGGVPQMPPGFQSEGIARFMSVTGTQGGTGGGGISGKTVGFIAAIGGGAGAAFGLAGGGGSETTTSAIGGITTSTPSSTGTSTAIGGVTSTTTTAGGGGASTSSATTTVIGGGSTTTVLGSTTTIFGSSTTTVVGGPTTTTVVGSSTTTSVGTSTTTTVIGSSTTTSVGTSTTTSTPSTTTSIGSTTTTSAPSTTTSTPSTTTRPSTTTSTPSTTTSVGSTTTTSAPSTTTTSAPSTTTSAPSTTTQPSTTTTAGSAQLTISKGDSPDPVVVGTVGGLTYTITIRNVGSASATSVNMVDDLPSSVSSTFINNINCRNFSGQIRCFNLSIPAGQAISIVIRVTPQSTGTITNRAAITAGPNLPSTSQSTTVIPRSLRTGDRPETVAVKTFLDIEPYNGRCRGRIVFNDSEASETTNSSPVVHHVAARAGENRVEAQLLAGGTRSRGFWRFDFGGSRVFVPGSLQVDAGQVYALDERSITFAVSDGSSVRFRYRVADADSLNP